MTKPSSTDPLDPTFRPLVSECAKYGICRSVAYELMNDGLIDTFKIGGKRYVKTESLRTLPDRLRGSKAA